MMPLPPLKEVDFKVIKEDWSRYLVNDGTILKVRVAVRKILEEVTQSPSGYPNFSLETANIVSAMVQERVKREPSKEFDLRKDVPEELGFQTMEEQWQEYHTHDGFKVFVKPTLVKVFRYNKYNNFGEPIYNLNIQSIVNAEKIRKD